MYFKGLQRQVKWKANVLPCCSNTSNVLAGASNEEAASDSSALHLASGSRRIQFEEADSVRGVKGGDKEGQAQRLPGRGGASGALLSILTTRTFIWQEKKLGVTDVNEVFK